MQLSACTKIESYDGLARHFCWKEEVGCSRNRDCVLASGPVTLRVFLRSAVVGVGRKPAHMEEETWQHWLPKGKVARMTHVVGRQTFDVCPFFGRRR